MTLGGMLDPNCGWKRNKLTWTTVVTLAEASSKALMGSSVAGTVRPRRYYKLPKEALESSLDDLENLINFFVIEGQRIVFAENVPVTAAVSETCSTFQQRTDLVRPSCLHS